MDLNLAFPQPWEPFGWPRYAELQEVRQSWMLRALLGLGWSIHDLVNRRDVKEFLAAAWKGWKAVERTETARQEQAWQEYVAWVARMMDAAPTSALVAARREAWTHSAGRSS